MKILCFNPKIISEIRANEPEMRRVQISAMSRKAGKAVDSAAKLNESDSPLVWKLKIKGRGALDDKEIESEFMEALKSDSNNEFFKKAGTALSSPLNDVDIKKEISNVERLLLEHWLAKETATFIWSLCYYNDKALTRFVEFWLNYNQDQLPEKTIRKVWERLGLEKARTLLFRDMKVKRNPQTNQWCPVPVPYKKVIQA